MQKPGRTAAARAALSAQCKAMARAALTRLTAAIAVRENVWTVAAPCRRTQRQAHGVPHVHIHHAVEVAASHAPKDEPTMQNTCRNGFVNIAMRRNNVPTVPALCPATQRQAHGVPLVPIRHVEVVGRNARAKVGTMWKSCRAGPAKPAR